MMMNQDSSNDLEKMNPPQQDHNISFQETLSLSADSDFLPMCAAAADGGGTINNLSSIQGTSSSSLSENPLPRTAKKKNPSKIPFTPKFAPSSSLDSSMMTAMTTWFHDYLEHEKRENHFKTVSFAPIVRVILVPSKEEYFDACLAHHVWYNQYELAQIEKEAIVRISLGQYYNNQKEEAEDEKNGDSSQIFPFATLHTATDRSMKNDTPLNIILSK